MEMTGINSSLVVSHGYDADSKTMHIKFRNSGSIYAYQNVGQKDYDAMLAADSIGSHVQKVIKPNFAHKMADV